VIQDATRVRTRRRLATLPLVLFVVWGLASAWPAAQAQAKKVLTVDDYTRWRSISAQEISGDGNWVAYGLALTNTATADAKPVVHLLNLGTNQDLEIPNATGARFSTDSKWIAYQVDPSGGRGGGRGSTDPVRDGSPSPRSEGAGCCG
jgi:hypothetical protein